MRPKFLSSRLWANPALLIVSSFALTDLVGALLLWLPFAHQQRLSLIDALFTSTSAICVTGLTVVNTAQVFTRLGQTVILLLIQLGGLGVMTFSVLISLGLRKTLNFRSRLIVQETFLPYRLTDLSTLIFTIVIYTFFSEFILAFLLFFAFIMNFPLRDALFHAVFHAISAFCNAGFSTFPEGLILYQKSFYVPVIIMLGVLLGNTGFPIIYEAVEYLRKVKHRFSLHFKLTLLTHFLLIVIGFLILAFLEWNGALAHLSYSERILAALFHSVSARTAGFNTLDLTSFSEHGLYFLVLLMFIGACPGSTGGGIKTTTLAVIWASALSRMRGYYRTVAFKRTIPEAQVLKAIVLLVVAVMVIVILHFVLTFSVPSVPLYQAHGEFLATLFEAVSAFGTVGLSTGLTPKLDPLGKLVIIVLMFGGRVGFLSLVSLLTQVKEPKPFHYAPEEVMIG